MRSFFYRLNISGFTKKRDTGLLFSTAFSVSEYGIATFFHKPFGSTGGSTNTNGRDTAEPLHVDFRGTLDEMAVGIDALAFVEQNMSVAAFPPTHKEYELVALGKGRDVWHAIGHLSAGGIETLEGSSWRNMLSDICDNALELVERLGCLRIKIDVA